MINAAAYTAVDRAETEIEQAFAVNETGCENLARVCLVHQIPLIHVSTDFVFDGSKSTLINRVIYRIRLMFTVHLNLLVVKIKHFLKEMPLLFEQLGCTYPWK